MRIDEWGLIRCGGPGEPGDMGDSCAEFSRWINLMFIINGEVPQTLASGLRLFRTDKGYVRHPSPNLPEDWREGDFSQDQAAPWLIAVARCGLDDLFHEFATRINGRWRFFNGTFFTVAFSVLFLRLITGSRWMLDLNLGAQHLLLNVPLRWSDSKRWFEWDRNASADWLNFFHALSLASPWVRRLVSREKFMEKVRSYYAPEGDSAKWLVDLYDQASKAVLG